MEKQFKAQNTKPVRDHSDFLPGFCVPQPVWMYLPVTQEEVAE